MDPKQSPVELLRAQVNQEMSHHQRPHVVFFQRGSCVTIKGCRDPVHMCSVFLKAACAEQNRRPCGGRGIQSIHCVLLAKYLYRLPELLFASYIKPVKV